MLLLIELDPEILHINNYIFNFILNAVNLRAIFLL